MLPGMFVCDASTFERRDSRSQGFEDDVTVYTASRMGCDVTVYGSNAAGWNWSIDGRMEEWTCRFDRDFADHEECARAALRVCTNLLRIFADFRCK